MARVWRKTERNQKKNRIKAKAMKAFRVESLRSVRRTPTRRARVSKHGHIDPEG